MTRPSDPRWGRVGKQTIVDGGPLPPHPDMDPAAKTNMEDVDAELVRRSLDFIDRSVKADTPFFLWHNATRMPRLDAPLAKVAGQERVRPLSPTRMMELDWEVGEILEKLDDLGIADNTIVMFTSDNGAEIFSWPDGGNHPFRGEKGTHLRGWLPRADGGEVARRHQAGHHRQRDHGARGLAADASRRSR